MEIAWTTAARNDFESHLSQLVDHRRPDAYRLCMTVDEKITRLADAPYSGSIGRVTATRELPLDGLPFLVVYTVKPAQVQILRVLPVI